MNIEIKKQLAVLELGDLSAVIENYERKSKFIYEFIEQRCGNSPTIFVGQYDVEDWHDCYRSHLICNNTIMVFWDGSQA